MMNKEQDMIIAQLACATDSYLVNLVKDGQIPVIFVIVNEFAPPEYRGRIGKIVQIKEAVNYEIIYRVSFLTTCQAANFTAQQLTIIDGMRTTPPAALKIIYNGPKTIVLWEDGTKTIVSCSEEDAAVGSYSYHAGFCAALAKKMYGSTSRVKKMIDKISWKGNTKHD